MPTELEKARQKGWEDCLLSQPPSILVSEISRIIVNLRKNEINHAKKNGWNGLNIAYLKGIKDVRKALELRKRSRVFTHIRGNGKVDRRSK